MFLDATLVGRIGGDSVYRKVAAKNILSVGCQPYRPSLVEDAA